MKYTYTGITETPSIGYLGAAIEASAMVDKSFESATYKNKKSEFKITFTGDLSAGDITILDGIVVDSYELPGIKFEHKIYLEEDSKTYLRDRTYTEVVQGSLINMFTESRSNPNRSNYIRPWIQWKESVDAQVKSKKEDVDAAITEEEVLLIELDKATLSADDPNVTLDGALSVADNVSSEITDFIDTNVAVTDPLTSLVGQFYVMQMLVNRREIFNDTENPLYHASVTPIIGPDGHLVNQANRILNLEMIHDKLGWHNQTIVEATYKKPKDLLIYYGYPNSFNSAVHGWYNEKVAQEMARYSLIVLGDGVQNPSHPDYANTQIIIPRIKELNPNSKIFGYVTVNQDISDFQTKTDQWDTLAVRGIFMDEAGYDYGKTRAEFNTMVDYVHGKTNANRCFANAWNTDNILGIADDGSYPNSTYNPTPVESNLTDNDWILLESFPINTTAYSGTGGYESKSDWLYRGIKADNLRATYGVNFASIGIINDGNADEQDLFNFQFISSIMFNLEANGSGNTSYGSGDAKTKFIPRPDVANMGVIWDLYPSVNVDTLDADLYYRYVEHGRFSLDFSAGAQISLITKW